MKKDFWLPLISDKSSGKYSLSKGNVMCWISFISMVIVAFIQLLDVDVENVKEVNETLKYLFGTTFMYSITKKGIQAYGAKDNK